MSIKSSVSYISLLWAIGLSIASIFMPPMGVIDSSVLVLIAQIIIFIATILGLSLPDCFSRSKKV